MTMWHNVITVFMALAVGLVLVLAVYGAADLIPAGRPATIRRRCRNVATVIVTVPFVVLWAMPFVAAL